MQLRVLRCTATGNLLLGLMLLGNQLVYHFLILVNLFDISVKLLLELGLDFILLGKQLFLLNLVMSKVLRIYLGVIRIDLLQQLPDLLINRLILQEYLRCISSLYAFLCLLAARPCGMLASLLFL